MAASKNISSCKRELSAQNPISANEPPLVEENGGRVDTLGYVMPNMDEDDEQSPPDIESEEEFQQVKQIVDTLVEKLHLGLTFGYQVHEVCEKQRQQ